MKWGYLLLSLFFIIFMTSWIVSTSTFASSLGVLADRADTIVIAVPIQKTSYWEGKIIKTRALMKVDQVVSGRIVPKEIPVVYDGGVVGSIGLKVSHGVLLPKGQKTILFLLNRENHYVVLDGIEGIFFVYPSSGGEIVIPGDNLLYRVNLSVHSLKSKGAPVEGTPLKEFIDTVHALRGKRP